MNVFINVPNKESRRAQKGVKETDYFIPHDCILTPVAPEKESVHTLWSLNFQIFVGLSCSFMDGRLHVIKWILAFFRSSSSLHSLKMVIFRRHFEREAAVEFFSFLPSRPLMTSMLKWKNKKKRASSIWLRHGPINFKHFGFFWTLY